MSRPCFLWRSKSSFHLEVSSDPRALRRRCSMTAFSRLILSSANCLDERSALRRAWRWRRNRTFSAQPGAFDPTRCARSRTKGSPPARPNPAALGRAPPNDRAPRAEPRTRANERVEPRGRSRARAKCARGEKRRLCRNAMPGVTRFNRRRGRRADCSLMKNLRRRAHHVAARSAITPKSARLVRPPGPFAFSLSSSRSRVPIRRPASARAPRLPSASSPLARAPPGRR